MFLTFLNVIVVRGILLGLPIGASVAYENEYSGAVLVTPHSNQKHIERTQYIEQTLPTVQGYRDHTARYLAGGIVQANYARPQRESLIPDQAGATIVGIDPERENRVTRLEDLIVEGRYLNEYDTRGVLVGSQLLDRYAGATPESGGTPETSGSIENVFPGDTIRVTVNGIVGEYEIVGVIEGKVGENSRRVFMHEARLRSVLDRSKDKKDEISVSLIGGTSPESFVEQLQARDIGEYAVVQTARESQGTFLDDITKTFDMLGTSIGLVGIIVAAITVFIVIFIVALNRQKQIGILKGIGINTLAIESSYVFLSFMYAIIGISLGVFVLYVFIAPYVDAHPIDFPFADGILVAPWNDTLARSLILVLTTVIAGYIPARLIVQKNTINAILGR